MPDLQATHFEKNARELIWHQFNRSALPRYKLAMSEIERIEQMLEHLLGAQILLAEGVGICNVTPCSSIEVQSCADFVLVSAIVSENLLVCFNHCRINIG